MTRVTMDTSSFSSFTPREPETDCPPREPAPPTPFISFIKPQGQLWNYNRHKTHEDQPGNIPKAFLDAMSVREKVYVEEQGVALENEFDSDDHRSCHWVIYASVLTTILPAILDPRTGRLVRPRVTRTTSLPIGTLRLVPFPHSAHPRNGGIYLNGLLTNVGDPVRPRSSETVQALQPQEIQGGNRRNSLYIRDFPTTFHNGQEPYVKLGRLAVLKEYRNKGIAGQLVRAAVTWMQTNYTIFNPSPSVLGFDRLGMDVTGQLPKWRGLFCIHAQEEAVKVWERYGFKVDEKMGKWWEEGIPHVGMWLRVPVGKGGHTVA
ncbi:Putative protein of unknown function [Podospora comata]|uniref:N-acetyltransferase domain-containing protein n=1 Tax=Podospora comata TaxID=48703 RepID=A0ABY6S7N3_PODCO|nr:Putative protein of unknown function [Podospora comata]